MEQTESLQQYMLSLTEVIPSWKKLNETAPKNVLYRTTSDLSEKYQSNHKSESSRSQSATINNNDHQSNEEIVPPIQIKFDNNCGRYLIASKKFSPGEVIFVEPPLLISPKSGVGPTCLNCLQNFSTYGKWPTCKKCGAPQCDPKCNGGQHTDGECSILLKLDLHSSSKDTKLVKQMNTAMTPLRTWLKIKQETNVNKFIHSLQSNTDKRKRLSIGMFIEKSIIPFIKDEMGLDIDPEFVHRIAGVFDTNAFEVDIGNDHRGRALFPLAALINHDCRPNTQHWFYKESLVVIASRAIPEGTQITNSYTTTLWGTKPRRQHLLFTKLFHCECPRCCDPFELGTFFSSIKCKECWMEMGGLLTLDKTSYTCNKCSSSIPSPVVDIMLKASSAFLSNTEVDSVSTIKKNLIHLTHLLGPQHYIVIELKFAFIKAIIDGEERSKHYLEESKGYIEHLLSLIEILEPGYSKLRGGLLLHFLKATLKLEEIEEIELKKKPKQTSSSEREIAKRMQAQETLEKAVECENILQFDPKINDLHEVLKRLQALRVEED